MIQLKHFLFAKGWSVSVYTEDYTLFIVEHFHCGNSDTLYFEHYDNAIKKFYEIIGRCVYNKLYVISKTDI